MMRGAAAIVLVLGALLAGAVATAVWAWRSLGEVQISGHGYLALVLGAVVTLAVGAGLMALVFFSSRRGYDEEAHRQAERTLGPDDRERG